MIRRKKENWLVSFYKDNVFYVWIVIGVVVISGISVGMALGKRATDTQKTISKTSGITYQDNNIHYENKVIDIFQDDEKVKENVQETNKVVIKESDLKQIDDEITEETIEVTSQDVVKEETQKNEEIVEHKELVFILPVEGEILKTFSEDTLVYSQTLDEWVEHTGIDIASPVGTPVKVIEDGTVIDIKNDPRYGYIIIVEHEQGYVSIYCNLSTLDMVTIGKKVEKGQVISGIGKTALFEIKDNPHLHFELMRNGELVNSLNFISQGE